MEESDPLSSSPASAPSLWIGNDNEVEGEKPCCRVCHGEGETQRPLYHPCRCDGSIKFVHQDCLTEWVRVSRQIEPKCELCGEKFQFRNVYASNAPARLSIFEFCRGILPRLLELCQSFLSALFLFTCWFILLPLFSSWWWDFCVAIVVNDTLPLEFATVIKFSTWWNGVIISCAILLVFAGISQLVFAVLEVRK